MSQNYGRGNEVRLSDAERSAAMASLGRALSEGRLTVDEYDRRVQQVAAAQLRGELDHLFTDLPVERQAGPGTTVDKLYSAQEIEAAHRQGKRPKAGMVGVSLIASIVAAVALAPVSPLSWLLLAIGPIVWIMLYVMKVGPDSWHVPSARQLEKERMRELKMADRVRAAELRAERRERTAELTSEAMDFAKRAIDRRKQR